MDDNTPDTQDNQNQQDSQAPRYDEQQPARTPDATDQQIQSNDTAYAAPAPQQPVAPAPMQQQYAGPTQAQQQARNGLAITALVLGITSIVTIIFPPLAILAGIAAIVFSLIAFKKNQRNGLSIAGLVTGIIGLIIAGLFAAFTIAAYMSLQEGAQEASQAAEANWKEKEELRQQYEDGITEGSDAADSGEVPTQIQAN